MAPRYLRFSHHYLTRHHYPYRPCIHSEPTQHGPAQPFWWELDIYSNGECDTEFTARTVDIDTPEDVLGTSRGVLYRAPGTAARASETQHDARAFDNLVGQYRTISKGFWVVFLDGMRWYPNVHEAVAMAEFGTETGRVPVFITSQGDPLGHTVLRPEESSGPLFSFIPRNGRAWDHGFVDHPVPDEPHITPVCIRDNQSGLMVIPNGRLMIWITGGKDDVPWHYFNMLRQRAGRINMRDAPENEPPAESAHSPQVPEAMRQVVREIGNEV
ncbi:hypothetical protein Hte_004604 [Hypoxylon texense]